MTTELIVVRHGESTFNRERRWQGQSQDALLSDLGWQQAAVLTAFCDVKMVGQDSFRVRTLQVYVENGG